MRKHRLCVIRKQGNQYKQAQKDFENAQKQVTALEKEAVKAMTGESQLDKSYDATQVAGEEVTPDEINAL